MFSRGVLDSLAGQLRCKELLDLAAVNYCTFINSAPTRSLKMIWEHKVSLLSKIIYFLWHQPILPSSTAESLWAVELICVISGCNHTRLTPGLIDMHRDSPSSSTNISVWPASRQHHLPAHSQHTCPITAYGHTNPAVAAWHLNIKSQWPYFTQSPNMYDK